ncbi:MAG TPA: phosphoribosylanthranilate isomerase [Opitutaceae bacterium]|jgi:phosphoribosylanthranilate isomerase|nr:phosphoribosylanthranilate isomerase [Opitutaceae bacterium]
MIEDVQLKVCGITSLADAAAAAACGADFLGFNFYPPSPRYVSPESYAAMAGRLPACRRVAILVEPTIEELRAQEAAGFGRFQIHFRTADAEAQVAAWGEAVGHERLWLAPKLPPGTSVPETLLPLADAFLVDGYKSDLFGGTGQTSDWTQFRRLREAHPKKTWILSGGLSPANIGQALAESGARFVDVNSGVESAPGVKDSAKLKALVTAIRNGLTSGRR